MRAITIQKRGSIKTGKEELGELMYSFSILYNKLTQTVT